MSNRAERRHPERHQPTREQYPAAALAWMHPGQVAGPFADSLFDIASFDGAHDQMFARGGRISSQSSPRLAAARCSIVREFLKLPPEVEYLLFMDSDMSCSGDTPYRMIASAKAHDVDILGGLCFVGGRGTAGMYPTIYALSMDPDKAVNLNIAPIVRYPMGGVLECDATGGAALLIHRRVLVKMGQKFARNQDGSVNPTPWFADGVHMGAEFGEDVVFCIRARQLGFKIAVDTSIQFGHQKEYTLDEDLYRLHLQLTGGEDLKSASDAPDVEDGVFDIAGPIQDMTVDDDEITEEIQADLDRLFRGVG